MHFGAGSLFFFLDQAHLIPGISEVNLGQNDTASGSVHDLNLVRVNCQRQQFANHVDEEVLFHVDLDPFAHQRHYVLVSESVTLTAAE